MFLQKTRSIKTIRVLVIGPSLDLCGGISSLIKTIGDHCPPDVSLKIVATHSRYRDDYHAHGKWRGVLVQSKIYCAAVMQVLAAIIKGGERVFHVHLSQEGSALRKGFICILLRVTQCPYLVHAHAAEDKLFHPWVPSIVRSAMLWGLSGCSYCLALTPFWADYYRSRLAIHGERVIVLPNPSSLPHEIPVRSNKSRFNLLFLGRLGKRKGVFDLIRAFSLLPENVRSRCHLTLAGDGEISAASELVAQSGCQAQITITGWRDRSSVLELLKQSDIFLLPSYAEGMALSVLEAMGWGIAVITTPSGGSTAYLEHGRNCLLVEPGNIAQISESIAKVCASERLRLELGVEARQTAAMLSIEHYMERLSAIYREMAGQPRPRLQGRSSKQAHLPSS